MVILPHGKRCLVRKSGSALIYKNNTLVGSGAYFGEMALMISERRSATVIAKVKTDCLILETYN